MIEHGLELGMTVQGFKFESGIDRVIFDDHMKDYVGVKGIVKYIHEDHFIISFNYEEYSYPLSLWKQAIVEEQSTDHISNIDIFRKSCHFLEIAFEDEEMYGKLYYLALQVKRLGREMTIKDLMQL